MTLVHLGTEYIPSPEEIYSWKEILKFSLNCVCCMCTCWPENELMCFYIRTSECNQNAPQNALNFLGEHAPNLPSP